MLYTRVNKTFYSLLFNLMILSYCCTYFTYFIRILLFDIYLFLIDDSYTYEHRSLNSKVPYAEGNGILSKESLFKKAHRELYIEISRIPWNRESKKFKLVDIWLQHINRNQVRFSFNPSGDIKQLEKQAGINMNEKLNNITVINTFTGIGINENDVKDITNMNTREEIENDLIYKHLKNIICNGSEVKTDYFLRWLSYIVRNKSKTGVAIVLTGGFGAGKGMFVRKLFEIFGKYVYNMTNVSHIQSCPSAFEEALLVLCDEVSPMNQKLYNIWKSAITEPVIQNKDPHCAAREFYHFGNFIFTSNTNNLADIIPIEPGERRFLFFPVSDQLINESSEYRTDYFNKLNSCDVKPFAKLLYNYTPLEYLGQTIEGDLDTIKAKIDNLPSFEYWWFNCLLLARIGFVKKESPAVFDWLDKNSLRSKIHAKKSDVYNCYLENCKKPALNNGVFWKMMKKYNTCTTGRYYKDLEYVVIRFNTYIDCCKSFDQVIGASGGVSWFSWDKNHDALLTESKRVQDYSKCYPHIGNGPESKPSSISREVASRRKLEDFFANNDDDDGESINDDVERKLTVNDEDNNNMSDVEDTETVVSDTEEKLNENISDNDVLDGTPFYSTPPRRYTHL